MSLWVCPQCGTEMPNGGLCLCCGTATENIHDSLDTDLVAVRLETWDISPAYTPCAQCAEKDATIARLDASLLKARAMQNQNATVAVAENQRANGVADARGPGQHALRCARVQTPTIQMFPGDRVYVASRPCTCGVEVHTP